MNKDDSFKGKQLPKFFGGLFSAGLGRSLLIRFLLISILPMAFIVWMSIQNSVQTITNNQTNKLDAIAQAKHDQLAAYFKSTITNLRLQAELENTVSFLEAMKSAHQDNNALRNKSKKKSLAELTKGYQWVTLEEEYGGDFSRFLTTYDYVDILLLDDQGNVLYSIRKDHDLGSNIFSNQAKISAFSLAAQKALKTGFPVYSDMEVYPPYNNNVASFLVQAVVDEYGDKLGLLAIHLSLSPINNIMQENTGLGTSGEAFLLGDDLLMRSNSRFDVEPSLLITKVETQNTKLWQAQAQDIIKEDTLEQLELYQGYRGQAVYSVQIPISFASVPMMLIAEIEESEALMPLHTLIWQVAMVLLSTMVIVILLSIHSTRAIVNPVIKLTRWAGQIAEGRLTKSDIKFPDNEIGMLNATFHELVDSFQDVTDIIKALSVGDLTRTISQRSDNDVLVQSLIQLNSAMQDVVNQSEDIAEGNYDANIHPRSDKDILGKSLQSMTLNLRNTKLSSERQNWLNTSLAEIAEITNGDNEIEPLANKISSYFTRIFNANVAVLFTIDATKNEDLLNFSGGYAYPNIDKLKHQLNFGESLLGQCAVEQKILVIDDNLNDCFYVNSALGRSEVSQVIVAPFITNNKVKGVIEIGGFKQISPEYLEILRLSSDAIAIAFDFAYNLRQTRELLQTTQEQQTELQTSNDTLQQQTQQLKISEQKLKDKSEALSTINNELTIKSKVLEKQKLSLVSAQKETEEKAEALEEASRYKSEFLANMSHELRTPLNSLLILSGILADNDEGNLTEDDVISAQVIQDSGRQLLQLINEILDLSKIESGQMTVIDDEIIIANFEREFTHRFQHMAQDKSIAFEVHMNSNLPEHFVSDIIKLNQIINNLVSNAIKFTNQGLVQILINAKTESGILAGTSDVIAFTIKDTGIGIADDKYGAIFEAFQQADGSTSRTHGGTGLGLSISLSFAHLLGGDLQVESELGKGSSFTLYLPLKKALQDNGVPNLFSANINSSNLASSKSLTMAKTSSNALPAFDDRSALDKKKSLLLIIEDDVNFAKIVLDECHKQNCQAIIAYDGESGLTLVHQYNFSGIILDYMLPGLNGIDILVNLKEDPKTQHIPVHIVSALDTLGDLRELGAMDQATKPISHAKMTNIIQSMTNNRLKPINVLIVEDDSASLFAIKRLLRRESVTTEGVRSAQAALIALRHQVYEVLILDLGLPDLSGIDLLDILVKDELIDPPKVIIHTGKDLSEQEKIHLALFTDRIVIKSSHSNEKLLTAVHSFVEHVVEDDDGEMNSAAQIRPISAPVNQEPQQSAKTLSPKKVETVKDSSAVTDNSSAPSPEVASTEANEITEVSNQTSEAGLNLKGFSVLLVDDDMRNTFALAKVLRRYQLEVRIASSGAQCLSMLAEDNDIDLVLMDIMMPEMDGYETMERIRQQEKFSSLAIIAVTANAMPGDDKKCLQAGANGYIAKPVNIEQLSKMLEKHLKPE